LLANGFRKEESMKKGRVLVKGLVLMVCLLMLLVPSVLAGPLAGVYCEGDFNYNGSVGAEDSTTYLEHFGRNQYNDPCPSDGPAPVPKTGQTAMYVMTDDGQLEKGVAWPNPRFTDNGDGTVTDNLTGLIWLKDAQCFAPNTWTGAISDTLTLISGDCGLTDGSSIGDWRLPNYKELFSLVDAKYYLPALSDTAGTGIWSEGDPFTNVQSSNYWSSTTYAPITTAAWTVDMGNSDLDIIGKTFTRDVWPVRGGH